MVQKSVKRGVHSGNTLRASNSKYNRLYRSQSCLVRTLKDSNSTDTLLDDLSITSDGIEYSLNKKGRWVVPQLLKEQILSNRIHAYDEAVKIQLVESHKIKRVAKCIGFYASKGPVKKVLPRKKTYFNVASVRTRNERRKRKSRPRMNTIENSLNVINENDALKRSPELNIEVFYPSPVTSSITHNPKYIRNWQDIQQSKNVQSKNGQSKKRARINSKCIDEFIDDYEYTCSYNEDEDDEEETFCSSDNGSKPSEITLGGILFHASKMQLLCGSRQKKSCYSSSENLTSEESEHNKIKSQQSSGSDASTMKQCATMLPVYVILPTADIQQHNLQELYGNSYMECRCFPRKFIIDITERVTAFAKKSKILKGKSYTFDFTASVIFEYDMNTQLDSSEGNVYKVYLNLKSKLNSVQIETIPDFMQTTIDEIVQRATFFVETISPDNFYTHQKAIPIDTKKAVTFQNLDECLGTNTEAYLPSYKLMYKTIFKNQRDVKKSDSLAELGFECVAPETCYICFESISAAEKSATALQFCGHWFCDQCWQDHLRSRIGTGYTKITCPEYKCEAEVDNATLLTLINVECVEQLVKRQHDSKVDMLKETKWCPNPFCGRVLKVQNMAQKTLNVRCGCGETVCFDCLQPAHWPASCDYTVNYWLSLKENGIKDVPPTDFVLSQFSVYGKNCPKCFRFIEKYGGCNYMECCCGTSFCWACLESLDSHPAQVCAQIGDKEKAVKMTVRTFIHDGILFSKRNSQLYKIAVQHRTNRNPWKTQIMKSNMWSLSTKLKCLMRTHEGEYGTELSEYKTADNTQNNIAKIPAFLKSIMDLYIEMNYVIEYTAVYLQENEDDKSNMLPVLERMGQLVDSIYEIFNLGINQDIKTVIPNLWELRQHSKRSIDGLVKFVALKNPLQNESETLTGDFVLL